MTSTQTNGIRMAFLLMRRFALASAPLLISLSSSARMSSSAKPKLVRAVLMASKVAFFIGVSFLVCEVSFLFTYSLYQKFGLLSRGFSNFFSKFLNLDGLYSLPLTYIVYQKFCRKSSIILRNTVYIVVRTTRGPGELVYTNPLSISHSVTTRVNMAPSAS